MRGKVLDYNLRAGEGLISGDDGARYSFKIAEWSSSIGPEAGETVDFDPAEGQATKIYKLAAARTGLSAGSGAGPGSAAGGKEKIVAALLAFFLGAFGAHKFYLGYNTAGIIMLLITLFSWVLFFLPLVVISVIAFIEFILYLVASDEEFQERYVVNQRPWF